LRRYEKDSPNTKRKQGEENVTNDPHHEEDIPPPLETIGGFPFSPGSDLPFGKPFLRMELAEYIIYERALEDGYFAGIRVYLEFIKHTQATEPVMLDDRQFTLALSHFTPQALLSFHKGFWRSHFIVGRTCVSLGIAAEQEGTDA